MGFEHCIKAGMKSLGSNPEVTKRYVDPLTFVYPRGTIASLPTGISTTENSLTLDLGKTTSTVKADFEKGATVKKKTMIGVVLRVFVFGLKWLH